MPGAPMPGPATGTRPFPNVPPRPATEPAGSLGPFSAPDARLDVEHGLDPDAEHERYSDPGPFPDLESYTQSRTPSRTQRDSADLIATAMPAARPGRPSPHAGGPDPQHWRDEESGGDGNPYAGQDDADLVSPWPARSRLTRLRPGRATALAALVSSLLVVAAAAAATGWLAERDTTEAAVPCSSYEDVTLVVDPAIAPALEEALADSGDEVLSTGVCARTTVVSQASVETAGQITGLASDSQPDLWVPDSSVWLGRVADSLDPEQLELVELFSLASSPLVVGASDEAVADLGWTGATPTWNEALTSGRSVALPDLTLSSVGVQALVALSATAGSPAELRTSLTEAALAIERGRVGGPEEGLATAAGSGADGPIVPTTEQQAFVFNRGTGDPSLVTVYPRDGSTSLDFPVVRLDAGDRSADQANAVEGVVRLLETTGRERAEADGFRPPLDDGRPAPEPAPAASPAAEGGQPSPSAGEPSPVDAPPEATAEEPLVVAPPSADEVDSLLAELASLTTPSRVLLVLDASESMRAVTDNGTRAEVTRDAAKSSLSLFTDTAAVGLWFFAVDLGSNGADHVEIVPIRGVTEPVGDATQREALAAGADELTGRLTPGGTGLFDTTLAAVREMQATYDPAASNTVVLVTDGKSEDPDGIGGEELVATLQAEADPERPVPVITIGLSSQVDVSQLQVISEATGGVSYLAERPEDFQTVLFDALRRR